jgi:hypothetical protein
MAQLEGFDRVLDDRDRLVDGFFAVLDFGFARDDVDFDVDVDRVDADDDRVLVDFGFGFGLAVRDDPEVERLAVDRLELDRLELGVDRVFVEREPAAARAASVTRERAPDSSSATRAASVSSWVRISRTSSTTRRSSRV